MSSSEKNTTPPAQQDPQKLLDQLVGDWQGTARTWLEANELSDESSVQAGFKRILQGRFIQHAYEGQFEGTRVVGRTLYGYNAVKKKFQSSWIDSYHMSYGIMFSEGDFIENGFYVLGSYEVKDAPSWGWRTELRFLGTDELTITAYNISPDGIATKAVETIYERRSKL